MIKIKYLIKEASMRASQVKPGMIGKDYNDENVKILAIVPARNWKQLKKYDHSGWMSSQIDMENDYEIDFMTDYLVAISYENGDKEVCVYGGEGILVPTK